MLALWLEDGHAGRVHPLSPRRLAVLATAVVIAVPLVATTAQAQSPGVSATTAQAQSRGVSATGAQAQGGSAITQVGAASGGPGTGLVSPSEATLQVGRLDLHPCMVTKGAYCGSIERPWDPSGHEPGNVRVGFAFVPAPDQHDAVLGTLVPHEGGPGYSTTGSAGEYIQMYGALLERRNLLLVDQRGTGKTAPIDCPDLQVLKGPYAPAAGKCGRSLGIRSDNFSSAESADDLAAVIRALELGRIDLYGDSYGTFFAQVFAGRHPGLLRSVVLDSAYPTYGETAWYPTQTTAMRRAFNLSCARSVPCATAGRTPMQLLSAVLAHVRQSPYRGMSHDADGRPMHVVVDAKALVSIAFGATYGAAFYREFAATLRSALLGDTAPLLRLTAQAIGGSSNAGNIVGYSEGADAAVACHDYPQLFDMTKPPAVRRAELAAAVREESREHPGLYRPFTIGEYLASDWEEQDWCTQWPVAAKSNPAGPPMPPSGHYSHVPVLVLSGELDSITTAAEGGMIIDQFPNARQVLVANSFHVTAVGDTDDCAVNVLRFFERTPSTSFPSQLLACTHTIPPIRTMGTFPQTLAQVPAARNLGGSHASLLARRAVTASASTVADLMDTWLNNYSGHDVGLRGGSWTSSGSRVTTFTLKGDRFTRDLAVSGTAVWDRYGTTMHVNLTLSGEGVNGRVHGSWDTRARNATAVLSGTLNGTALRVALQAP